MRHATPKQIQAHPTMGRCMASACKSTHNGATVYDWSGKIDGADLEDMIDYLRRLGARFNNCIGTLTNPCMGLVLIIKSRGRISISLHDYHAAEYGGDNLPNEQDFWGQLC